MIINKDFCYTKHELYFFNNCLMKKFCLLIIMFLSLTACSSKDISTISVSQVDNITMTNVESHSSETDCWTVIDGKVYDLTEYTPIHPGEEEIFKACGQDASGLFKGEDNGGRKHSESAGDILNNLYIGDLN